MARNAAFAALAVLLCAAAASANNGCTDVITGYSATYGARNAAKLTRFQNQTAQWRAKGAITKANVYYSTSAMCVQGIKMTYGYVSTNALLLGKEQGLTTRDITLAAGEFFNQVQIKGASRVEYLRLTTNKGRTLAIGNSASAAVLQTAYPTKTTGFLASIRGYEEYTKYSNGTIARGPLDTLQLVWANCVTTTSAVPLPSSLSPSPSPSPAPTPAPAVVTAPKEPALPVCPQVLDSCATTVGVDSQAYCPIVSPFAKRVCIGGCCASGGKCTSSSCTISGIGKEVANVICYGINQAQTIGATPDCLSLGCYLTVPGCTSNLLGGSCLGTVVDMTGGKLSATNPAGLALLGKPCLDVTVSDTTLKSDNTNSQYGHYVAKLWSVCDCNATVTAVPTSTTPSLVDSINKLNYTDVASLLTSLKGVDAGHPLQVIAQALKAEIPGLVVPMLPGANLTSALTFLGSLVNSGSASSSASPLSALLNFVKGAGAVAKAANTTNPLGAVLGALTTASANGTTNPLAGLANLVTALAPKGADSTEKADVLSSLLDSLNTGKFTSAPVATLVGAVSKILSASGSDSPLAEVESLLSKFTVTSTNKTGVVAKVQSAVAEAKAAADRVVSLLDVVKKLQAFLGGSSTGTGTSTGTSSSAAGSNGASTNSLLSLLNAAKALTSGSATTTATSNPLSFLTKIIGAASGSTTSGSTASGSTTPTTTGTSSSSGLSLQSLLDVATKVAHVLQSLSGAADSANASSNPLSSLLNLASGSGSDSLGLDLSKLGTIASKVSPLLSILGGNSNSTTTGTTGTTNSGPLGAIQNVLSALGVGGGGGGLNLSDLSSVMDLAQKAAPVLKALQSGTTSGSGLVSSIQSFLQTLGSSS